MILNLEMLNQGAALHVESVWAVYIGGVWSVYFIMSYLEIGLSLPYSPFNNQILLISYIYIFLYE